MYIRCPCCKVGYKTSKGFWQHQYYSNGCKEAVSSTVFEDSEDESDGELGGDSSSHYDDNASLHSSAASSADNRFCGNSNWSDDDAEYPSSPKRARKDAPGISFLESFDDGSFPLKPHELEMLFTTKEEERLPPIMECQFAIYSILNHPSVPRYIYSYIIRIINMILHGPHRHLFASSTFTESRNHVQAEVDKYFSAPKVYQINYKHESLAEGGKVSAFENASFVGMDVEQTVLDDILHPIMFRPENLALNPATKWKTNQPIVNEDGTMDLNEVVSGSAYREACEKLNIDQDSELAVPYSGYIDEVGITANLRNPTQPFLIKCLLPRRGLQRYRLLAYVPCAVKSASEKKNENLKAINGRNYHAALEAVFKEFDAAAERLRKQEIIVTMGGTVKQVRLVPFLVLMIGDHKSQQANTCKFGNSGYSCCIQCLQAHTWDADDPTQDLSKGHVDLESVKKWNSEYPKTIASLAEVKQKLKSLSHRRLDLERREVLKEERKELKLLKEDLDQKFEESCIAVCHNAFFDFKSMPTPIFAGCPPDHLHVFMLGILKHGALAAFSHWTPSNKAYLDEFSRNLFLKNRSTARQRFPRYPLDRGMTNLSLVTAKEWVGFWFVILVVGHTRKGSKILSAGFADHFTKLFSQLGETIRHLKDEIKTTQSPDGPVNQMNIAKLTYFETLKKKKQGPNLDSILLLVEDLLIFHYSVYKENFTWSPVKQQKWKHKMNFMVGNLPFVFPRTEGNGWKFPKLHLQQHLPYNIARFGSPRNIDAMSGEKALQAFAKNVAKTVAKNVSLPRFNSGLAQRLYEFNVQQNLLDEHRYQDVDTPFLDIAKDMFNKQSSTDEKEESNDIKTVDEKGDKDDIGDTKDDVIDVAKDHRVVKAAKPHWTARFHIVIYDDSSGESGFLDQDDLLHQNAEFLIYTLEEDSISYYIKNAELSNLSRQELKRDLVRWMVDAVDVNTFKRYLPIMTHEDVILGEPIVINGYFQAGVVAGSQQKKKVDWIRCHPNFYSAGPRYDFVLQNHNSGTLKRHPDKFGGSPDASYCPSKLLLLYDNPMDGTLRAVLHTCALELHKQKPTCLVEHHRLDVKRMLSEEGTLFLRDGHVLSSRATAVAVRKATYGEMDTMELQRMMDRLRKFHPACYGASLQELSHAHFVLIEETNLFEEYDSAEDPRLEVTYVRDPCYWSEWMEG